MNGRRESLESGVACSAPGVRVDEVSSRKEMTWADDDQEFGVRQGEGMFRKQKEPKLKVQDQSG